MESIATRLASLDHTDTRITESLAAMVTRWTSAAHPKEIEAVPQEEKALTDEELFTLIEQQAGLVGLVEPRRRS
jgi:hypothetical protein